MGQVESVPDLAGHCGKFRVDRHCKQAVSKSPEYATTCLTDSKSTDLLRSKWVKWNQCQIWPVIVVSFALVVTANKLYQHSKYATTCLTDSKSTNLLRSKWVKWNQCHIWPVIVVSFVLVITASCINIPNVQQHAWQTQSQLICSGLSGSSGICARFGRSLW